MYKRYLSYRRACLNSSVFDCAFSNLSFLSFMSFSSRHMQQTFSLAQHNLRYNVNLLSIYCMLLNSMLIRSCEFWTRTAKRKFSATGNVRDGHDHGSSNEWWSNMPINNSTMIQLKVSFKIRPYYVGPMCIYDLYTTCT